MGRLNISRRKFLSLSAGAFAVPYLPSSPVPPSSRINIAYLGIGGRGWDNISMFAHYADMINVVALCDTEMGAPHTQAALKLYPSVPRFNDYRALFDGMSNKIDAVVISTPDFAHFPAAMLAMSLGKAVYCEKPLCNTFGESMAMVEAAARTGVVTQMGNQGHSDANFHQFKALREAHALDGVTRITAWMASSRRWHKWNASVKTMPGGGIPPAELNWKAWQSQRPARDFSEHYIHGDWRAFYEYGTGALGDWGAHLFDASWECLELGFPDKITCVYNEGRTDAVFPLSAVLHFHFPARGADLPECVLEWYDGIGNMPETVPGALNRPPRGLHGSEIHLADGRVFGRASHGSPLFPVAGMNPKDTSLKRLLKNYPRGLSGHYLNFLKAVRGEEKTNSPFEVAGKLSALMALGAIAERVGVGELVFDREKMHFMGNAFAEACLSPKV